MKSQLGYETNFNNSSVIKKIYLELTDRCNLNCTICYRKSWDVPYGDLEIETLDSLISQLEVVEGLEEIVIGGLGEPSYHKDFIQTISKLEKYNLHITTNGTLMTEETIKAIVGTVNSLTISVDGIGSTYEKIRGTDLDRVIRGIEQIQQYKSQVDTIYPYINLQFVASKDNIGDIYNVIDLGSKLNARTVVVSNLLPQTEQNKDKILYSQYQNTYMKDIFNKARNYSLRKGVTLVLPNHELKSERHCRFMEDTCAYICASGDMVPCYRFSHDYTEYVFGRKKNVKAHVFGNIKDNNILDIWNSSDYQRFRHTIYNNLYPSCIDCDLTEGCDLTKDAQLDCYGTSPNCGDCLWTRNFVICP